MTQGLSPSSETDNLVSIRLDGLIGILQGLCLDDRKAISVALLAGTSQTVAKEPVANPMGASSTDNISVQTVTKEPVANMTGASSADDVSVPAPDDSPAATTVAPSPPVTAALSLATTAAFAPAPTVATRYVYGPVTVVGDSNDKEDSSDDEDAANAAVSLTEDSTLRYYNGKYFNVPNKVKAPLYYITRGRYIGVFSGWDATGPKVLGVSRAIYHKVESVEQGAGIVERAIECSEAVQRGMEEIERYLVKTANQY
ncbi:uncharacterized protein F5891DRAFT_974105 [Suillus fuscotomentosus]|uniref:Uncharacterized protein n=1 Tax=Suillus fuscotomentosus TaxID=1912939 RepID=A0AAD4HSS2_9AGAM|nr:uncharacterized protein F5891DRAFT_974105 [Suillus fuscotomentosus]KAG1908790.1 hypothetical protein F5891DRAFT_974105 [Suillus fuscotomentosus]